MKRPKEPTGDYIARIHRALGELGVDSGTDPLSACAPLLAGQGLNIVVSRVSLAEAVWQAHLDSPVLIWCDQEQCFLIVLKAGTFRVRLIIHGDSPDNTLMMSRGALARRLGLSSIKEEIEIGIVHAKLMQEHASIHNEIESEREAHMYSAVTHKHDTHDDHHAHHHMPPLRRLLKLLRPERREILLLLVFAFFSGLLYLTLPLVVDAIVTNIAFGNQSKPYIQALVVISQLLTACLLLQALIIGFQYYVAELIQRRIFVRIAGDLSHRLPRVVAKAFDQVHAPELVNRFLDSVTVQKNTAFFLLEGINLVASTIIGLLLLALYHPMLMIFVAVLIVLIIGFTWPLGRSAVDSAINESRCKYDLVGWFEQIAAFPNMFKGRGGYLLAHQRTDILATQYVHARRAHFRIVLRQISALLFISVLASVALLILGVELVISQQLTLGQLVASELIMSSIVASLIKLGKKLETWYDTMAAIDKIGHLLDLDIESEGGEKTTSLENTSGMKLAVEKVSFGYHAGHSIFHDLTFTLEPGTRACILGCQGSGVSSFLNLCFALREPSSGHISFDGLDLRAWNLESLRNSMELLRRDEFVVGTVADNLRLGRQEITTDEIHAALATVGMLDDCMHHPDGVDLMLQVGGTPFSTSQRCSLLIARAIVQKPRLLLIDELFDGLDDASFHRLTKVVFDRSRPWTVIVATRMPELRNLCDQAIEL